MFNYAEGYPIVEARPSAGLLTMTAFQPVQTGIGWLGDGAELLDPKEVFNPNSWSRGDIKKTETYNQWFGLQNLIATQEGSLTGLSNFAGLANEPLKLAIVRQSMGKKPLTPWEYSDYQLTPEALEEDKKRMYSITEYLEKNPNTPNKKDLQDQLSDISNKLLYAEAETKAKENLGFDTLDLISAQDWLGYGDPKAGSSKDIEDRLSAYDPNFDPDAWFASKTSDDVVFTAMMENGISVETIRNSPNADHALFKIMSLLNDSTIKRRMATYKPSNMDMARLLRDTVISGVVNNPGEVAFGIAAELTLIGAGAALGSMVAPVAGTAGGAVAGAGVAQTILPAGSMALRLKRAYDAASLTGKTLRAARYATETLYKMPLGVMPSYVSNYGLIRSTLATTAFGAVQGFAAEAARQEREIAFGAATLYANPFAMEDYNTSLMVSSAVESGLVFGGVFGLGGNLLRTGFGALKNRTSGVLLDPTTGMRARTDKSWSLSGTPLGKTIDNFKAKFDKPVIDKPVPEKLAQDAALSGDNVTPEKLVKETEARVNRVETKEALESPEAARATPEDVGTRRHETESIPEYLARVGPAKAITNSMEFFNNLARRTRRGENENLVGLSDNFTQMNHSDQLTFLMDAEAHVREASRIETESVGLSRERQKVYEQIELSRKAAIRNLKRKMPTAQFKLTMAEYNKLRKRSDKGIPELLLTVRDKTKSVAERREAANDAAMKILEAAQNAAKSKDKAEDIAAKLPEEVRDIVDVAMVEQKLTNGVVSESTMDDIFSVVTGDKPKAKRKPTMLESAVRRANVIAKFDKERLSKIKALIDAPEKFLDLITGDKDSAAKFFQFVNDAVTAGVLTKNDRLLVLASVVHLNFSSKVFNLKYAFEALPPTVSGRFDKASNTIILNNAPSAFSMATRSRKVASTIIHEIGHAYFRHTVNGDIYQEALKAFNRLHESDRANLFALVHKDSNDPLLNQDFGLYYFQNMEEIMVESWSKILLLEGESAIVSLKPHEATLAQTVLNKVIENITLVAQLMDSSDFYYDAKKVLDLASNINDKLENTISVSKLYEIFDNAENAIPTDASRKQQFDAFNNVIETAVPNAKQKGFTLSPEEFDMWYSSTDSAFKVALIMSKSTGKELVNSKGVTKDFIPFLKSYEAYKQAQMNSIKVKLSFLLGSTDYTQLRGKTKEERLTYLEENLFSNFGKRVGIGDTTTKMLSVTYQEDQWYWNSSGQNLINAIENLNITPESALSREDLDVVVTALRNNTFFTQSPIENLRTYLEALGLDNLANLAATVAHRKFFEDAIDDGGMFDMVNESAFPEWSTKEIALNNLELMLKNKVDIPVIMNLLQKNMVTEVSQVFLKTAKSAEELVELLNAAIQSDRLVYNPITQLWGIPVKVKKARAPKAKTGKKKQSKAQLKKLADAAQETADITGSTVVTKDNLVKMLEHIALKRPSLGAVISTLFFRQKALIRRIEEGKLQTLDHLINLAKKQDKQETLSEQRKSQQAVKAAQSAAARPEGEGGGVFFAMAKDRVEISEAGRKANLIEVMLDYNKELNGIILSPEEAKTAELLIQFPTDVELAAALKKSRSSAQRERTKILKKLQSIGEAVGLSEGASREEMLTAIRQYFDGLNKTVEETKKVKPTKTTKARVKEATTKKTQPAPKETEAAATIAMDVARTAKLQNKTPDPVPVVTGVPIIMPEVDLYRISSEVTGNTPEVVLRPPDQADALVASSTVAVKESVNYVPQKPVKIKTSYNGTLPNKIAKLKEHAIARGNDAIIFGDGVVMPLEVRDIPSNGRTERNAPLDQPIEAVLETEKNIPVRKIRTKTKKTTQVEDAPKVVQKPTTENKPGETAVTVEKEVRPEEHTTPDLVQTTPTEKLERQVNDDIELLRENGMDTSFLRLFTAKYWNSKLEADASTVLTDGFKAMWTQFVLVNQYIANANRLILGEDIMVRFWSVVDRLQKEQLLLKVTEGPGGKKPLTYLQVLQKAAKEVTPEGKPEFVIPLIPENVKFIKADAEGNYRLSATSKKQKQMIDEAGTEPVIPPPPVKPAAAPEKAAPAPEVKPPEPLTPKQESIARAMGNSEDNATLLLRENNLVGRVFGGSQRELRTWWRNIMNSVVNATQMSTKLGHTIRSFYQPIVFMTRFFDDTRAQTAHLVAAGKEAHQTAMHMKAQESRLIISVLREYSKLHAMLPRKTQQVAKALDFLIYDTLRLNKTLTAAELEKIGVPAFLAKRMADQANAILKAARMANKTILDLETELGRIVSVDSNGNPLDPNLFAPTQVDHEVLSALDMLQRAQLIRDLAAARTKRKLKDQTIDRNTMVALGWLDIRYDPKSKTVALFSPDRTFSASEAVNMFSLDTLAKLKVGFVDAAGITGDRATVLKMLNIADPENYFVTLVRDPSTGQVKGYDIHRVPKVVDDLSPSDLARYRQALSGDTSMYIEKWRQKLGNRNLIEVEVEELIKQKTRQYPYDKANAPDSIFQQAHFRLEPTDGEVVLPIRGLTPEEFMETDLTKSVLRTNMAEAYYYFLNGRYFELAFQKQLNKLFGRMDVTKDDMFDVGQAQAIQEMKKIAEQQKWLPDQVREAETSIMEGVTRLREEYQFNANTLPYQHFEASNGARVALSIMKFQLSPGFGISALGELFLEIIKDSPSVYRIPKNIFTALRYTLGDVRLSKRKLLEGDLGDMTFVLENFRTDLSNRFMGEFGLGAFRSDSRFGTRMAGAMANIRNGRGAMEKSIRTMEEASKFMQSIGSLQAITNSTRVLAKVRLQRFIWNQIKDGRLERLLVALAEPQNAEALAKLKMAAMGSAAKEREYVKKFAGIARHSAGMVGEEAALFLKYGLTTVEQVRHLKWAIEQANAKEGRVDIIKLMHIQQDLYNNPVKNIDPETLNSAIQAYGLMLEDLITKEAVSEVKGLNKITTLSSKSAGGRIWSALSTWIRSFQDNVILDFGSRSTTQYLFSSLFLWMAVDTMVSLLKEYLAGREVDDIMAEMEEQPEQYVIRGVSRIPFLGVANGLIESAAWGMSAATGGSYEYYGVPLLPPGPGATMATVENMWRDMSTFGSKAVMDREFDVKSLSNLLGGTTLVNRSPLSIPIRMLEKSNAFKDYAAIQQYLDSIHRKPYPYKNRRMRRTAQVNVELPKLPPRNYLIEQAESLKTTQRQEDIKAMVQPKPTEGVSSALGDILGRI